MDVLRTALTVVLVSSWCLDKSLKLRIRSTCVVLIKNRKRELSLVVLMLVVAYPCTCCFMIVSCSVVNSFIVYSRANSWWPLFPPCEFRSFPYGYTIYIRIANRFDLLRKKVNIYIHVCIYIHIYAYIFSCACQISNENWKQVCISWWKLFSRLIHWIPSYLESSGRYTQKLKLYRRSFIPSLCF